MEKIEYIIETLEELFPNPTPSLNATTPFTILIATLLSASALDRVVNTVTPHLFSLGPTPEKMALLSEETIESIIHPVGLGKSKAKAIKALSILLTKNGGEVPKTVQELIALPGVGRKTALVVLCHAFSIPTFPVDTHIFRLAHRFGLSSGKNVNVVEEDLKKIFPMHLWKSLHLQFILYGREFCKARGHLIDRCPICRTLAELS